MLEAHNKTAQVLGIDAGFPMQEEKDNRVYSAIDGALRANMFRQTQPRWLEWQKFFLSIIPFTEISAARAMLVLSTVVPNPEIQNGLALRGVTRKGDRW